VGLGDVDFGEAGVAADHLERGVTEQVLERIDVASVAQEVDGECVPEAVRVDVVEAGAPAEAVEVLGQVAPVEWPVVSVDEEALGAVAVAGGVTGDEVAGEEFGGSWGESHEPLFACSGVEAAFAGDGGGAGRDVDVGDAQFAEFADADAGVEEEEEDGAIAEGAACGQLGLCVGAALPGRGERGGVEELLDLVAAERFDDGRLGLRRVDALDDVVGGVAFFDGPGPEAAEAGVDIADGFGGEGARGPFGDAGGCDPCGH